MLRTQDDELNITPRLRSADSGVGSTVRSARAEGKYLNLGCGARIHPAWTNVDIAPQAAGVISWNLRSPLPFGDATFAVVYHSHLLEHFSYEEAARFLHECFRVLEPGGVLRVVVPDLEQIARLYLEALERALEGGGDWQAHYDWMMLEFYDQAVREQAGGEMRRYLEHSRLRNEAFVVRRTGAEGRNLLRAMREGDSAAPVAARTRVPAVRRLWTGARHKAERAREWLVRLVLRNDYEALRIGRFRLSGEIHRWMYDRYSLGQMMVTAGFLSPRRLQAAESTLEGWASYCLDVEPDGSVYKPDSLFMEAKKPADRSEPFQAYWPTVRSTRISNAPAAVT